jgi:hypothetical protein
MHHPKTFPCIAVLVALRVIWQKGNGAILLRFVGGRAEELKLFIHLLPMKKKKARENQYLRFFSALCGDQRIRSDYLGQEKVTVFYWERHQLPHLK